jgi:hypothetical protein
MRQHPMRRLFEFGGYAAAVILIAFGVVALVLGINGYRTVGDELSKEYIVGGSDMAPDEIRRQPRRPGCRRTLSSRVAMSLTRRSTLAARPAALRSTCASTRWRARGG